MNKYFNNGLLKVLEKHKGCGRSKGGWYSSRTGKLEHDEKEIPRGDNSSKKIYLKRGGIATAISSREGFRRNYLKPALNGNYIRMTIPDKPNSKNQRYIKG